jgi:hypothetical protein
MSTRNTHNISFNGVGKKPPRVKQPLYPQGNKWHD